MVIHLLPLDNHTCEYILFITFIYDIEKIHNESIINNFHEIIYYCTIIYHLLQIYSKIEHHKIF